MFYASDCIDPSAATRRPATPASPRGLSINGASRSDLSEEPVVMSLRRFVQLLGPRFHSHRV